MLREIEKNIKFKNKEERKKIINIKLMSHKYDIDMKN